MSDPVASVSQEEISNVFIDQRSHKWVQKNTTAAQRIEKLIKLRETIEKYSEQVSEALYKDLRRSRDDKSDLMGCFGEIDDAIENLEKWMEPRTVETSMGDAASGAKIIYEARGIVLLFGAWNFPFNLVFQPLVQIYSAGNCAIVKPNEVAPNTSAVTAKIIREVFQPDEVSVFEGDASLANRLLELPVDHIFFTGSPAIGKVVMTAAAKHLASVTLELGGKNPVIVGPQADIADAASKIAFMRNMNSGQVCLCPENIYVHEDSRDKLISGLKATFEHSFYKDGELNQDVQGRIVNSRNLERIQGYLEDAKGKGAKVVCGGDVLPESLGVSPTILTDVPENAEILHEEVFGPVLSIFTYSDISEVFHALHEQQKPLALYVFSQSEEFVEEVLSNTTSGGVTVNNCMLHFGEKNLPFGGINHSGIGSYRGEHGFRELSHARSVLYAN